MRVQRFLIVPGLLFFFAVWPAWSQTLYWTDVGTGKIQRVQLGGGTGIEDLVTTLAIQPVDVAVDPAGGKMYWTEASPADFMISRANLDGSDVQLLVTGLSSPSGIELDPVNGHIYWTDVGAGKIQRASLNGSLIVDLVDSGVVSPVDIALDVPGDKMYWTEASPADFMISRANLDGSNVEGLVTGLVSPSGIALDLTEGKIYWTDRGSGKIQRSRLDGSGVEDLVTTGIIEPVRIVLDLSAGQMYWTEASPADFMISRADLDGTGGEWLVTGLTSPSGVALEFPTAGRILRAPGAALAVDRAGGEIVLAWGGSCTPSDTDYEIYEGTLGDFTSHMPKLCTTGGATTSTLSPTAGSTYYLVVPRNGSREGSYGIDSTGAERPPSASACLVQAIAACP